MMVRIAIDISEDLNKELEHLLIDYKDILKNKNGNPDKRIAIIEVLECVFSDEFVNEFFESFQEYMNFKREFNKPISKSDVKKILKRAKL